MRQDGPVLVARRRDAILLYHAVGEPPAAGDPRSLYVSPEAFERQLAYVAEHAELVPLAALAGGPSREPSPRVAVTFDDGFRNVLEHASPVLERLGATATVFVSTSLVRDGPPSGAPDERLSADELLALIGHGFEIGSHGHRHVDLGRASREEVVDDLERSRSIVHDLVGEPPRHLAWPYGSSSPVARAVAAELGFEAAFATERWPAGPFARERVGVYPSDGELVFRLKASGWYGPLRRSPPVSALAAGARSLRRRGRAGRPTAPR